MQFLDGSFGAASLAIANLIANGGPAGLPEVTFAALAGFYPSPVDRIVTGCEALYAAIQGGADVGNDAVTLCAQLAQMCVTYQFHELGQTDRGNMIVLACRRILGEVTEQDAPAAEDPVLLDQFEVVLP